MLNKTYKIPADIFRKGYTAYQKKYVYPKSYIFMAIFLVFAANFVYGAVKDTDNFLAYILIVVCLALAVREWYNPRRLRRSLTDAFIEMGEPVYRLQITDDEIIFSTEIDVYDEENGTYDVDENGGEYEEDTPEPSKLPINNELKILEYDSFFLIVYGKEAFYIVPKEGFSDAELEIIRDLNKNINQGG